MRHRLLFVLLTTPLVIAITAEIGIANASFDDAFWVSYWARPKTILNPPEEEAFYSGLKEVMFARNVYDRCENPSVLDEDARWLKEHPGVRFYVDGYASKRGNSDYNLVISQRRADWVKQSLINRGVAEDRIKLSVGWGELYPTCLEDSDECLAKNKVVRFTYVMGS
jgi:outer membrane protein OmpA-like peptidoglycan-associated protein